MSYCRFTDADIYLYSDIAGYINCQVCTLAPLTKTIFTNGGNILGEDIPCCEHCGGNGCEKCMMHDETHLKDAKEALDHVRLHRENGDYVPSYVDERLLEEIAAEQSVHPTRGSRAQKVSSKSKGSAKSARG